MHTAALEPRYGKSNETPSFHDEDSGGSADKDGLPFSCGWFSRALRDSMPTFQNSTSLVSGKRQLCTIFGLMVMANERVWRPLSALGSVLSALKQGIIVHVFGGRQHSNFEAVDVGD